MSSDDDAKKGMAIAFAVANDVAGLAAIQSEEEYYTCDRHGSTCLHWAAGQGALEAVRFLVEEMKMDPNINEAKKAGSNGQWQSPSSKSRNGMSGRSPLHFAARNGRLAVVRYLCEVAEVDPDHHASHAVTPFQLAVWQNHLDVARYLVEQQGVDCAQLNDFRCGAQHWLGLAPKERAGPHGGRGLLPMAKWLFHAPPPSLNSSPPSSLSGSAPANAAGHSDFSGGCGLDCRLGQRQGHRPLHKAAWGGHLALVRWLRRECHVLDDARDTAGNLAADIADMGHHHAVARWLRRHASGQRAAAAVVLGVDYDALCDLDDEEDDDDDDDDDDEEEEEDGEEHGDGDGAATRPAEAGDREGRESKKEKRCDQRWQEQLAILRAAYLARSRETHPDRQQQQQQQQCAGEGCGGGGGGSGGCLYSFDEVNAAYKLLCDPDGTSSASVVCLSNPRHSLPLLLRMTNEWPSSGPVSAAGGATAGGDAQGQVLQGEDGAAAGGRGRGDRSGEDDEDGNDDDAQAGTDEEEYGDVDEDDEEAQVRRLEQMDPDGTRFFKARLVATVLEYGEQGLPLAMLPKKFEQIWHRKLPSSDLFPHIRAERRRKKLTLSKFLAHFSDVVAVRPDRSSSSSFSSSSSSTSAHGGGGGEGGGSNSSLKVHALPAAHAMVSNHNNGGGGGGGGSDDVPTVIAVATPAATAADNDGAAAAAAAAAELSTVAAVPTITAERSSSGGGGGGSGDGDSDFDGAGVFTPTAVATVTSSSLSSLSSSPFSTAVAVPASDDGAASSVSIAAVSYLPSTAHSPGACVALPAPPQTAVSLTELLQERATAAAAAEVDGGHGDGGGFGFGFGFGGGGGRPDAPTIAVEIISNGDEAHEIWREHEVQQRTDDDEDDADNYRTDPSFLSAAASALPIKTTKASSRTTATTTATGGDGGGSAEAMEEGPDHRNAGGGLQWMVEGRVQTADEALTGIGLHAVQEAACERSTEVTSEPRSGEVEVKVTRQFVLPAGGPVALEMVVHTPCKILD